jgi:hypothetical protein
MGDLAMRFASFTTLTLSALMLSAANRPAAAQPVDEPFAIVLGAGRPLRVTLDHRVTISRIGQVVDATVVDPQYVLDRIGVPSGTRVRGRVASFEEVSRLARARAMLGGNFSPLHRAVLEFDTLILEDGREIAMQTRVSGGAERVRRRVAGGAETTAAAASAGGAAVARARGEAARRVDELRQRGRDAIETIKSPGRMERFRDAAIRRLPYYRPFLSKGTVFDATLIAPISIGEAVALPRAPAGTAPAPGSILAARLVTPIDSKATPRGTPIEAVLTEPVFSAEREVILPEGTRLTGEVTFAKTARRFRRNGQLRFLFDTVHVPDESPRTMLASLHAVESAADGLGLDEEGGATVTNSKTRFIAPVLAVAALHAGGHEHHAHLDGGAIGPSTPTTGSFGARGFGGFLGFGLIGVGVSQISAPAGLALAAVGVVRTTYVSIVGKGQEVSFPAATPIELQLAPGPPPPK